MSTMDAKSNSNGGARVAVQRFGRFLSGMVMPNMGAFIAWGLITALFIPTGWFPNEGFAQLVDLMKNYLLPLLIGYTGGTMIHGQRGGVIGGLPLIFFKWINADCPEIRSREYCHALRANAVACSWFCHKMECACEMEAASVLKIIRLFKLVIF